MDRDEIIAALKARIMELEELTRELAEENSDLVRAIHDDC